LFAFQNELQWNVDKVCKDDVWFNLHLNFQQCLSQDSKVRTKRLIQMVLEREVSSVSLLSIPEAETLVKLLGSK